MCMNCSFERQLGITITDASKKKLIESGRKIKKKAWIDKSSCFYKWIHDCRIMIKKYIEHIMNENLLLLKHFLQA